VPLGSYGNVLEMQIHGDQVWGRICWEEEGDKVRDYKVKGGGITKRTSRLLKPTAVTVLRSMKERGDKQIAKRSYEGWLSLQWAKDERVDYEGVAFDNDLDEKKNGAARLATNKDSGPWVSSSLYIHIYELMAQICKYCILLLRQSIFLASFVWWIVRLSQCHWEYIESTFWASFHSERRQ
jgi:hypothetical protein